MLFLCRKKLSKCKTYSLALLIIVYVIMIIGTMFFSKGRGMAVVRVNTIPNQIYTKGQEKVVISVNTLPNHTYSKPATSSGKKLILIYLSNHTHLMRSFEECEVNACQMITNPQMYNQCDAYLVNLNTVQNVTRDLPPYKPRNMTWIAKFREAPSRPFELGDASVVDGMFNAVMTYSKRSDIFYPYGRMELINEENGRTVGHDHNTVNYAKGRTKSVAWLLSHCYTKSKRELYGLQLQRYIDVSIYGGCGIKTCKRGTPNCNPMEYIGKHHKFYLSFENSLCDEYVTEKLWNAMQQRLLPIVLGVTNYSKILPKHSFIDIRDYSSPQLLAKYLITLDKNDTLYNQYFWWTNTYFVNKLLQWQCDLCEYLYRKGNTKQTYKMSKFWDPETCMSPKDFYSEIAPEIDFEMEAIPHVK